ncbi:DUF3427 domain-containing protein [Membranicola marinus]|uniref:DUF3427 domain-containing protein n=1 Tax=Membranihabitans marinus TaxID=1227546 RepID=A0A953L8E3_9BACT|nr:DUF3427 domain-containing protein [Membranihabitans marinus]MBY5959727.1 DUF3427 domain-containing protein [Membranihabitans marinus]
MELGIYESLISNSIRRRLAHLDRKQYFVVADKKIDTTYEKQSSNREGVALNRDLNTEALFVNLLKSEEDFSPTTMYDDYAINETLFHWQSQNSTSPDSEKGKSYIYQEDFNKNILLFVREAKRDSDGFTHGYVFLGPVDFVDYKDSKPMSIKWSLEEPIPNYLWKESAKLAAG